MEILIEIIVPIFASLLGGLFTFLGIKMTINHENKIREADLEIEQEKQRKQEIAKNIEINKKIILTKPELTLLKTSKHIKSVEEFYLLPYEKPKLVDEEKIFFGYSNDIFNDDYWDKYEIILQNSGKREILVSFLQIPYKFFANIYCKSEILDWKDSWAKNYYNDEKMLISSLKPNEKIQLIINYPKTAKELEEVPLNIFMQDEDGNFWIQPYVNFVQELHSDVLAPDAFYEHLRQNINKWYIYDSLYFYEHTEKSFQNDLYKLLEERKEICDNKENEFHQFVCDVHNGLKRLKYNLPID